MTEAFPFPLPPRPLLPRLIAGNNRGRPGSQPMEVKVVSLTGTGRGGRTCHPASVDRPSRPLSSAVQPSVPPLPPPLLAAQSPARPRPPCPPPSASLVRCLDLQRKVGASRSRRKGAVRT